MESHPLHIGLYLGDVLIRALKIRLLIAVPKKHVTKILRELHEGRTVKSLTGMEQTFHPVIKVVKFVTMPT